MTTITIMIRIRIRIRSQVTYSRPLRRFPLASLSDLPPGDRRQLCGRPSTEEVVQAVVRDAAVERLEC